MYEISNKISQLSVKNLVLWIILFFSAFLAGLLAAILPYWLIIAIMVAPIFPVVAWMRPEYAILGVVALGSGLIKAQFLPMIPIMGGSVTPQDLALLILIPIIVLKFSGTQWIYGLRPFVQTLSFLFALLFISVINAYLIFKTPIKDILGEFRHFFHWLLLPMLVITLDNEIKFKRFIKSIWVIAIVFSLGQIIQSITGVSILGQDDAMELGTLGHTYAGLFRGSSAGINFSVYALYFLVGGYLLNIKLRIWILSLSIVFFLAILVSFGRGLWATTLLGVVIMMLMAGFNKLPKLIGIAVLMILIGGTVISIVKPAAILALEDRALSVGDEVDHGSSMGWRFYETKIALEKLQAHPIFGIGLGASYRPISASIPGFDATKYVHDGYLYMILKLGPMSLLVIYGFMRAFFMLAKRMWKMQLPSEYQVVILASVALFIQLMILSVTQPEFLMKSNGIGLIAIISGLLSVVSNFQYEGIISGKSNI